jgi:hypothetical protein
VWRRTRGGDECGLAGWVDKVRGLWFASWALLGCYVAMFVGLLGAKPWVFPGLFSSRAATSRLELARYTNELKH